MLTEAHSGALVAEPLAEPGPNLDERARVRVSPRILPIAILVLEMHYFVDIPVGFAIAGLVIFISDRPARRDRRGNIL